MLWMAQPLIMAELVADAEAVSRGLTARLLIFNTEARRECDDRKNLSFDLAPMWNDFIEKILYRRLNSSEPTVLVASDEAREVFCKMHDHSVILMANQGDLDGEVSRWRENSIKVAGLLAVADGAEVVTESHAKAAVEIVKWCGNNYLEFHKNAIKSNLEGKRDKVVALLKATPGGQLCLSDLQKRHNITRVEFTKLVQSFPTIFEITKGTSSFVGGRPGEFAKLK